MAHRADNAELVGHAGRLRPHLAEDLAGQLGLHHAERAAILQRGVGLGVERLLLGHSARAERYAGCSWPAAALAGGPCAAWAFSQWSKSPRTKPIAPSAPTVRNSRREGADKGFPWDKVTSTHRSNLLFSSVWIILTVRAVRQKFSETPCLNCELLAVTHRNLLDKFAIPPIIALKAILPRHSTGKNHGCLTSPGCRGSGRFAGHRLAGTQRQRCRTICPGNPPANRGGCPSTWLSAESYGAGLGHRPHRIDDTVELSPLSDVLRLGHG